MTGQWSMAELRRLAVAAAGRKCRGTMAEDPADPLGHHPIAAFYAAVRPARVLWMLDELRRLRAETERRKADGPGFTSAPPTVKGYWWVRERYCPPVVVLIDADEHDPTLRVYAANVPGGLPVEVVVGCEWAGPLVAPAFRVEPIGGDPGPDAGAG